jgi:hypothetical protein
MTGQSVQPDDPGSPVQWTLRVVNGMWRDMVSVYYANTTVWRALKSAALIFLGFFCWIGGNLTLVYVDWVPVRYVMAYGFVLLFWGPFTHVVIVPLVIRLRRTASHPVTRAFSRHGSKASLTLFLVVVVVLGTFPPGLMTFQFQVDTGASSPDVSGDLQCTKTSEVVHCHLANPSGVDHIVVVSGGETLVRDEEPPFEFEVPISEMERINEQRQFTVELRDEDGNTLRRFVQQVNLIAGE